MTVVLFGAGAVGSLFGARFAAAGRSVLLIARPDHVAAIRTHGLRVEGVGAGTYRCDAATELPPGLSVELALLTVKTFDLPSAATALGRGIPPTPVLLPQNGIGLEAIAGSALRSAGWPDPGPWVVRAVHTVPATWVSPGVVRAAGTGEVVLPEPSGGSRADGSADRFVRLFRSAGIPVRTVPSIEREVWRKALVNAAINPVTAIHGVPNGRLVAGPLREEAAVLLREALSVAAAAGFDLAKAEVEAEFERVVRATAENRSSMLQDLDRGRPTEIDAISGEILRLGEARGLDLPSTRSVVARVREQAALRRRAAQSS
ncbi:MAG: ketopantoate reductase family protein [Thermoplasmata archaeon]